MSRGLPLKVSNLLDKAKESALLAVDVYNKPRTTFRAGGFIVLMCIAWTSLLHSIFERDRKKYFYKDNKHPNLYLKIDGDYKAWDLEKSAIEYFKDTNNPIFQNIEFFYKLRNKIEHRFMPSIDPVISGECQALLLNFEEMLVSNYSEKHSLIDSLFIPLQFTEQRRNLPKSKQEVKVLDFITQFRSNLSSNIINSQEYSFKAFFIPKLGNHRNSSDIAVEFVKFDPNDPGEMKKYEKLIVGIKEKTVPVINPGKYKPSKLYEIFIKKFGTERYRFLKTKGAFMHWHTLMWKKHKVRPSNHDSNKLNCNTKYCQYDEPHQDYIYTKEWIEFLIKSESL